MTDLEVGSIVYRKFYSRTDKVRILELSEKHHTDSSMYYRDMKVKICGMEKIRQYRIPFYIENFTCILYFTSIKYYHGCP